MFALSVFKHRFQEMQVKKMTCDPLNSKGESVDKAKDDSIAFSDPILH